MEILRILLGVTKMLGGTLLVGVLLSGVATFENLPWERVAEQPTAEPVRQPTTPPAPQPNLPVLTAAQRDMTARIAFADPRLRAALATHPHHVTDIILWTGPNLVLLGAVAIIAVDDGPAQIAGDWAASSATRCDAPPDTPPVIVTYRATYTNVRYIHAVVRFQDQRVAFLYPGPGTNPGPDDNPSWLGDIEFTGQHTEFLDCAND